MPRVVAKISTIYTFDELSDSAKETAREWWRRTENEIGSDYVDYDDFVECAKRLGITFDQRRIPLMGGGVRYDPTIYYSGFSSQGDGACFEGSYSYAKGSVKAVKEYAPTDTTLHAVAEGLAEVQKRYFYRLSARVRHSGYYYHAGCTSIDVFDDRTGDDAASTIHDDVAEQLRAFMDWIYARLRDEYEWRMSDENVDESMLCNGYTFDKNGNRAD